MTLTMKDIGTPSPEPEPVRNGSNGRHHLALPVVGLRAVAPVAIAVSVLSVADADASRLATDFCSFGNLVVVGKVEVRRSFLREPVEEGRVWTTFEFRVERVIVGPPLISIELDSDGGIIEGRSYLSSASLRADEGDRLLLILNQWPGVEQMTRIMEWEIDPAVSLPDERELAMWWSNLCSACSEGYPSKYMTMLRFTEGARAQREGRELVIPQPPLLEDQARCEEHTRHLRQVGILP